MNKEELIEILQKRSQETLNSANNEEPDSESNHEKYISKLKFRREEDKKNLRFGIIISILVVLIVYLLVKPASNPIANDPNYISKQDILFTHLPTKIRDNYVYKEEIEKTIKKSQENQKNRIIELEKEVINLNKQLKNKTSEEISINLDALTKRSKRYEATGCYIMNEGEDNLYNSCKKKIDDFLIEIKNMKARSYEIIAVMGSGDRNYTARVLNDVSNKRVDKKVLKRTLLQGIARARTLKASSYLKKKLGKNTVVTYVSYTADTANKRGFTIRAYK